MTLTRRNSGYDAERLAQLVARNRQRSLTAQDLALETLRQAILDGTIEPGARLRQEDLAGVFDASRIPVREALRALELEGLVTSEPHRGFTVTTLDADQIEEIYDLRSVLEGHAIRLAIPLLTEVDLDDLQRLYDEMRGAEDPEDELARRERFYMRLYSVTARPRLVGLIARLRHEVSRSLRWKQVQHSPQQHEVFFEAIKQGDADTAVQELSAHYTRVAALLRRYLREAEARDGYSDRPAPR